MGKRELIFHFRLSATERALIANLAERLQRNQSDAVRFVVINAAIELAGIKPVDNEQQIRPIQNHGNSQ
jgi:hypothetical protein